jgi:hypothetical protein
VAVFELRAFGSHIYGGLYSMHLTTTLFLPFFLPSFLPSFITFKFISKTSPVARLSWDEYQTQGCQYW